MAPILTIELIRPVFLLRHPMAAGTRIHTLIKGGWPAHTCTYGNWHCGEIADEGDTDWLTHEGGGEAAFKSFNISRC
jgi:hypothetical protein